MGCPSLKHPYVELSGNSREDVELESEAVRYEPESSEHESNEEERDWLYEF